VNASPSLHENHFAQVPPEERKGQPVAWLRFALMAVLLATFLAMACCVSKGLLVVDTDPVSHRRFRCQVVETTQIAKKYRARSFSRRSQFRNNDFCAQSC
jgi:hypothetical protein